MCVCVYAFAEYVFTRMTTGKSRLNFKRIPWLKFTFGAKFIFAFFQNPRAKVVVWRVLFSDPRQNDVRSRYK